MGRVAVLSFGQGQVGAGCCRAAQRWPACAGGGALAAGAGGRPGRARGRGALAADVARHARARAAAPQHAAARVCARRCAPAQAPEPPLSLLGARCACNIAPAPCLRELLPARSRAQRPMCRGASRAPGQPGGLELGHASLQRPCDGGRQAAAARRSRGWGRQARAAQRRRACCWRCCRTRQWRPHAAPAGRSPPARRRPPPGNASSLRTRAPGAHAGPGGLRGPWRRRRGRLGSARQPARCAFLNSEQQNAWIGWTAHAADRSACCVPAHPLARKRTYRCGP